MLDFVDNAHADLFEYLVRYAREVGRHKVGSSYAAQSESVVVCTEIAHNADGAIVCENGEVLVDIAVEVRVSDLLAEDKVCVAKYLKLFARDLADDSDSESGTREGLTPDEIIGQSELCAELSYFVLEVSMTSGYIVP